MKKIRQFRRYLWNSLWFLPALLIVGSVLLAIILIDIDTRVDPEIWSAWPRLFGAGASGSRGMLEAIATSMITVAGVVFSITILAIAQASSQYSSRLLRNFIGDRTNQTVLGVFVSIFIYCLVVLRTIRGGSEGAFVPSLAVLGGFVLAFLGIGFLIYFIHHIAISIQASQIVANVAKETLHAIDNLFPQELGEEAGEETQEETVPEMAERTWRRVPARHTGYIQAVDISALLDFARRHEWIVRMEQGIGDFAIKDTPLVTVSGPGTADGALNDDDVKALNHAYTIDRQRTIDQDAAFGIRQIVDVANKALSPGINDTTTAILCLEYLTAIMVRLTRRQMESPYRMDEGELRVIAFGSTFSGLLHKAFAEIRHNGEGSLTVLAQLAASLQTLADVTTQPERRRDLLAQAEALQETVRRTVRVPLERERLGRTCLDLVALLKQVEE